MGIPGGIEEVKGAEHNLEIIALAKFAVDEHNKKWGVQLVFQRVISAKEQIVAGTLYYITLEATDGNKIKVYEAKVVVQTWKDTKEVLEFKYVSNVGGFEEVKDAEHNLEIIALAKFAVQDHNEKWGAQVDFQRVISAKQEVVAGYIFWITLEATDGKKKNVYEAKVWVQAWMNFMEVLEFKYVGPALVLGGLEEVKDAEHNVEMIALAKFAVEEYNKKEGAQLVFKSVLNAKVQIVSGSMYYITLEATVGDKIIAYDAKVWVKPWMHFKELLEFQRLLRDASAEGASS